MKLIIAFLICVGLSVSAAGWYPAAEPEQAVLSGLAEDGWEASYCSSVLWCQTLDVVVKDTLAYIAMCNGLYVLNVVNPAQPAFVSQLYIAGGPSWDISVESGYAYLAGDDGKLYVVDIANPASPQQVATYAAPDRIIGVDVSGSLAGIAYGGSDSSGVIVLDISRLDSIVEVANYPADYNMLKVAFSGSLLYAVGCAELWVIDPSDPEFGRVVTGNYPVDLSIQDTLVVLADKSMITPGWESFLTVVNVADRLHPQILSSYSLPGDELTGVDIRDTVAIAAAGTEGLYFFSVADPTQPRMLSLYTEDAQIGRVRTVDTLAYVLVVFTPYWDKSGADSGENVWPGDIRILNVADPSAPTLVGMYPLAAPVTGLVASDGLLAALNDHDIGPDVVLVDDSDRHRPVIRGNYSTPGSGSAGQFVDSLLYLAARGSGVEIINVADPTQPALLGTVSMTNPNDIVVRDTLAFAVGDTEFVISDVSDPTAPRELARQSIPYMGRSIALYDNYAVISDGNNPRNLDIYDITDPEHPTFTGRFSNGAPLGDVAINNTSAVWSCFTDGIAVVDLSDPANPHADCYFQLEGAPADVCSIGPYAIVACDVPGLAVVDVSNPESPVLVGTCETPGYAFGVAADSEYIYVADHRSLIIFQHHLFSSDVS
ncbi:MAG: hypothetical protein GYA46_10870, partial [candidate division Zixibacteria bacterium]|nr:hypothetical protein [candidate division Zixibacteria bacterium]